ncbi:NADP oxidoreductase coenzyme F420-dependent [Phascolomyces articulosus]|uniref:NADP oxidoreductase coenzyme F420-dependent n=1 Tax=Phascolomyces articulosus TaxID=60185 RepID=A0AAD5PC58_9FUNG|nr:NADP oxidoreductase coenzyme F420-dependent [Phascolomyces articulosus]
MAEKKFNIKTIGFIGTGGVNSRFARISVDAGFNVLLSNSRGPASLHDLVSELGPRAKAVDIIDQLQVADIVLLSVPFGKLENIAVKPFVGKVIIDTMNYYPLRDENIALLDTRELTSSELVQRHFEGAHVVKGLHNMDLLHIVNGVSAPNGPWAIPITGDNNDAKECAADFIKAIGYEAVDCGHLKDSWKIEADTPLYLTPYVGKIPEGLSKEEAMYWYKKDNTAKVTRQDVLNLAQQATQDGIVGGNPGHAPKPWLDWMMWEYSVKNN